MRSGAEKDFYCGLYDIIFRGVFLKNKDVTAFICEQLIPEENIKAEDIEYINESIINGVNFKTTYADVRFKLISDNLYGDIEMQKNPVENFTYRIDLYTSGIMADANEHNNKYEVKKVIVISFCNFDALNNKKPITIIQPLDVEDLNGYKYYWRKNIYVQLPFMEKCDRIRLTKFIEILKSDEPDSLRGADPFMNKVIDEIKKLNQDEKTRALIRNLEKQERDVNTRIATAEAEAEARGEVNKALAIAKNLKENNISIDIISSSTGLSKEEIEKL